MDNYWKHIDDFFREKLGRYRETPPPDVWEALDKQLDGLIPSPSAPSAPRPSFRWLGHVAMVSLVAVLSIPLVKKIAGSKATRANSAPVEAPVVAASATPAATTQATTAENKEQPGSDKNAGSNAGDSSPASPLIADAGTSKTAARTTAAVVKTSTGGNKNHGKNKTSAGKGRKTKNENAKPIAGTNNYNSGKANSGIAANDKENTTTTKQLQPAPKTPAAKETAKKTAAKKAAVTPTAPPFSRLEAGLKVGYERGASSDAASKYTISPYIQYNLSKKFSLLVQPAAKYAQLKTGNIGNSKSYYKENHDGVSTLDSSVRTGAIGGTQTYANYYTYSETHDSVVKSYKKGGSYLEFEIPILLKYKLTRGLSVYAGPNFLYHKVGVAEQTYTKTDIARSVDYTTATIGLPTSTPTGTGIDYSGAGTPIASYKGPLYPSPKGMLNIGYMLGFSYEYSNKWLFDALLEQSPAGRNMEGGYNVNGPVSAAYFRLSVGYKFIK